MFVVMSTAGYALRQEGNVCSQPYSRVSPSARRAMFVVMSTAGYALRQEGKDQDYNAKYLVFLREATLPS